MRAEASAEFHVYGKIGYQRDGSILTVGKWRAYNYNNGTPSETDPCLLHVYSSAMMTGPDNTTNDLALIVSSPGNTAFYNIVINIEPGVILQSNRMFLDIYSGTTANVDGVHMYGTALTEDGEYQDARTSSYAIRVNSATLNLSNVEYNAASYHFLRVQNAGTLERSDKAVVTLDNCSVLTEAGYLPIHVGGSNNTDLVINSGHYENTYNGNIILFDTDDKDKKGEPDSTGVTTINGGTFKKYYSAGMFKVQGHRDIIVNGGSFETYNGSIFGMAYEAGKAITGSLTITGGDFSCYKSYAFNQGTNANFVTDLDITVTGGNFYIGRDNDPLTGEVKTASGVFYMNGNSTLTITGGTLESELLTEYANAYMVVVLGDSTANISGGFFQLRTNGGSTLLAQGNGVLNISGGYFASNGDYVARPMAGKSTNAQNANGAVTTESFAELNISGGVFVLNNRTGSYTHPVNAVISNGGSEQYGLLTISGGIFINARDEAYGTDVSKSYGLSNQVILKYNNVGGVRIDGGIMLASPAQEYFYFTYGNADGGYSIPEGNIGIRKGVTPTVTIGGMTYYYGSYAMNTPLASELDAAVDAAEQ